MPQTMEIFEWEIQSRDAVYMICPRSSPYVFALSTNVVECTLHQGRIHILEKPLIRKFICVFFVA